MRSAVCLLFMLMASTFSLGQNKLTFHSSNSLGYLTLDNSNFSFQTINGVALHKKAHFGIGLGLERLDQRNYLPLFFETKFLLGAQEKPLIPFLAGTIGKEFSVFPHTAYGGLTCGVSAGINHFFSPKTGLSCSMGYRYVNLSNSIGLGENTLPVVYNKNMLELRIGLIIR